jgi:hypothetical protein
MGFKAPLQFDSMKPSFIITRDHQLGVQSGETLVTKSCIGIDKY